MTVKAGYDEVPGTFKIALLYAACAIRESPDITIHIMLKCYVRNACYNEIT